MSCHKLTQGIISINVGSSSVKFCVYALEKNATEPIFLIRGSVDGFQGVTVLTITDQNHQLIQRQDIIANGNLKEVFASVYQWILKTYPDLHVKAVGHRVVHGGTLYPHPVLINDTVIKELEKFIPFVPQHQPSCLMGIHVCEIIFPGVPQVACFDTSFHTTLPFCETHFALPLHLWDEGIRRYGFHGLSYQYIADQLPEVVGKRLRVRLLLLTLVMERVCALLRILRVLPQLWDFQH